MIKVFIADNHPLIRRKLKETLEREVDMQVIGEAENTPQVMTGVRKNDPDILITSLSLRGRGSLNMIRDVKRLYAELHILVLTMHPEERFAIQTFRSGASGYLTKDMPPEEIIKAVRALFSGKRYIPVSLAKKLELESAKEAGRNPDDILSRRELQVFYSLASGKKLREIAEELSVSVQTASKYRSHVFKKMEIKTLPELKMLAGKNHPVK